MAILKPTNHFFNFFRFIYKSLVLGVFLAYFLFVAAIILAKGIWLFKTMYTDCDDLAGECYFRYTNWIPWIMIETGLVSVALIFEGAVVGLLPGVVRWFVDDEDNIGKEAPKHGGERSKLLSKANGFMSGDSASVSESEEQCYPDLEADRKEGPGGSSARRGGRKQAGNKRKGAAAAPNGLAEMRKLDALLVEKVKQASDLEKRVRDLRRQLQERDQLMANLRSTNRDLENRLLSMQEGMEGAPSVDHNHLSIGWKGQTQGSADCSPSAPDEFDSRLRLLRGMQPAVNV